MIYTTKVNKNKDLIALCENHARSLGFIGDTYYSDWFWMHTDRMDYGVSSKHPTDWLPCEYKILDLADFLMVKPQQQEVVLGCSKIFLRKDSLTDGQHSISRDSTKLKNLLSVFREGMLSCEIFGHKVQARKGHLWIDDTIIPTDQANIVAEWLEKK